MSAIISKHTYRHISHICDYYLTIKKYIKMYNFRHFFYFSCILKENSEIMVIGWWCTGISQNVHESHRMDISFHTTHIKYTREQVSVSFLFLSIPPNDTSRGQIKEYGPRHFLMRVHRICANNRREAWKWTVFFFFSSVFPNPNLFANKQITHEYDTHELKKKKKLTKNINK